jgi:parvulin-like peptidyl-prolyl isomerase
MTSIVYFIGSGRRRQWQRCPLALLAFLAVAAMTMLPQQHVADAFLQGPAKKIEADFRALTTRVTTRHILVGDERVARVLKQKIRDQCVERELWVVDAFESAAKKYSRDEATSHRGGLIGELVPQGYCRSEELDRLQFSVSLGNIVGPVETEKGYHLLLVSERTNFPALDGDKTRIVRKGKRDVFGTLDKGGGVEADQEANTMTPSFVEEQLRFWIAMTVATGVLAEWSDTLV